MPGSKAPSAKKSAVSKSNVGASKNVASSIGAPSQRNQASRKGKRAWRKNVDIEDVEVGLEGLRAEERATGTILQKQKDDDLFQIDVKGDDQIRKSLPRFSKSQLTSTKILAQRSAVPAVLSRTSSSAAGKRKTSSLSNEEKSRLLRMGKRLRRGPLNSYMDPTEFGAGSAIIEVSEAVKQSGGYDPWADEVKEEVKDGLETVKKPKVKAPALAHPRNAIELPAIIEPHQGTSYNPLVSAHQELLLKAHEIEERREREAKRLEEVKKKIEEARQITAAETEEGVALGMAVDKVQPEEEEIDGFDGVRAPRKVPERKTKQQRQKAARLLAEKRALAEKAAKKRMLATISTVKALRAATNKTLSAREQARVQRQLAMQEKLKRGLVGHKLGKHKVPEGEVDVQLGEDLSESLRQLKPEGNLFRDRFLSLQQRALIEPRVRVIPKKRRNKIIEYEKHAWKRFE